VPKDARWSHLQANAKQPTIGKLIDDAMLAIESSNASLKGVLPKDYNRPALNKIMLGELIDLVSGIAMHGVTGRFVQNRTLSRLGQERGANIA
jgi:type I restriction enzyme M protein